MKKIKRFGLGNVVHVIKDPGTAGTDTVRVPCPEWCAIYAAGYMAARTGIVRMSREEAVREFKAYAPQEAVLSIIDEGFHDGAVDMKNHERIPEGFDEFWEEREPNG